jgi:hypothetical protein
MVQWLFDDILYKYKKLLFRIYRPLIIPITFTLMLNMLSITTAITLLVMATSSIVEAAPATVKRATNPTRIAGLEKIKHVVYFMQVNT